MDNLKPVAPQDKTILSSLRRRLYDELPPKGTTLRQRIRLVIFSHHSPREIALGAAIGVFLACSPFLGIHTVAALGLALLFGASRLTAVLGTLINNPVTMTFLYLFELRLGSYILGYSLAMPEGIWKNFVELFSLGRIALLSIMTGFMILGLASSVTMYLVVLGAVLYVRKTRAHRSES